MKTQKRRKIKLQKECNLICAKCKGKIEFGTTYTMENNKPIHVVCVPDGPCWD